MVTEFPTAHVDLGALSPAIALGSLDGRYRGVVAPLVDWFSEAAVNRARLFVEIEWLIWLTDQEVLDGAPVLSAAEKSYLRGLVGTFGADEIATLSETEAKTKHDVKAVEYLLKSALEAAPEVLGGAEGQALPKLKEMVHIFCTSEDINNLTYAILLKQGVGRVWLPAARALQTQITDLAQENAQVPMLAHTHGQPATPTTLGHELAVFAWRMNRQLKRVEAQEYLGKINGATGDFAAHTVAVPGADWPALSRGFVEDRLGLTWNPLTTQIESHDYQAELYATVTHFNRIAHNLATDIWTYISLRYFAQDLAAQGSTGSSTMPHKINPIRFENAEANLEISSGLFEVLEQTLVTTRMQRDLTDSTTQRNIGTAFGHSLLAIDNLRRGLAGLKVDAAVMAADLDDNWEVLGEAVQQTMRVAGIAGIPGMDNPYERLKELTRGHKVDGARMREFISGLGLPPEQTARLQALTPATYTGLAAELVDYLK
ncbi:adenylosuccinate lyase [Mobiluncus curtisii]|uniref:Adenylosuccinate lyase n=1 Tax=Mobiluncus curtisii TaxID=2051 RepID=A0A7Y0UIK1_9ACTO|nr:adenylosuccinate lyase [Mobiluncus curtisii]MCU9988002.1 adenylosuccinate lyase [Mobiluncus curtisii]MCV0001220.1 adenylosuccinate lyase [Mobiluncus curtisii]NMW50039.1 adenylosuccinate lyase [Mobiluncus curtisii]NMW87963.1 adenylosuccinate lyase [Mobiluncus curtisii]NMX14455.1 adenylosuccinate lyase [Mobiluncus curtisii]